VGTVVDRDSGAPISGAIVRFDRSTPVATSERGRFESQYIEGGPIRVTVAAEGYEPGTADLDLPADDVSEVQVALAPAGAMIRGTVEDARGPRASATVQVFGPSEQTIETDADGAFMLEVPVGEHRLVTKPDDALATGALVEAKAGETAVVALRLLPRPDEPVEPVDGRIPLPEPLLFEPESGTPPKETARNLAPVIDLLLRRPDLEVRVAGHTDNRGDAAALQRLSEARAKAVRDLLVQKGVPPAQLSTQGYGADRPIAPNVTRRGRAQNNRVEIEVVE
jgi:outer membrane protein OmpA-like peptidoglycan-associated protein